MKRKNLVLTVEHIRRYVNYLREQERAAATIQKYAHDLSALLGWLDGQALTKAALIVWKEELAEAHAPATVNSMIAAVNGFFKFMDWRELTVKPLKIQRSVFCDEHRELTREEYARLVRAAERKENQRLALIPLSFRPSRSTGVYCALGPSSKVSATFGAVPPSVGPDCSAAAGCFQSTDTGHIQSITTRANACMCLFKLPFLLCAFTVFPS